MWRSISRPSWIAGQNRSLSWPLTERACMCRGARLLLQGVSHYSTESEFLHRSIVPTDHFQKSLPRLPVPKLEKTCERYLNAQRPLLSDEQYQNTEKNVNQFLSGDGQTLHKELVAQDNQNKHTSYISGPWFDMYLAGRVPVMLNHNPFMMYNNDADPQYNNQLLRSTNMVVSSLKFMKTLRANILEPEVYHLSPDKSDTQSFRKFVRMLPKSLSWYGAYWYKAFPLDMSQYARLFNSTRIPKPNKDELFTDASARHLVVLRNGNYFKFDVIDRDGNIVSPDVILAQLKRILADDTARPEFSVSVLTSENRDTWAAARKELEESGNQETLKQIDSAVFLLVMDSEDPQGIDALSRQFLHGNGSDRWFDKSFQLIFTPNGIAASNFEHSWGDGVAMLRYFNEIFKDAQNRYVTPDTKPATLDSTQDVKILEFKLNDSSIEAIKVAKANFDRAVTSLDLGQLDYKQFNKSYIKSKKLSPDSVMQLVIQMAFLRQYGYTAPTYESCSTAAFKHGRTETIRSATMATKQASEMLVRRPNNVSIADIMSALQECSKVHTQLTKEAAMGQGFDRHLFALRVLAENGGNVPDLFKDDAYKQLNHVVLSTSTLTSPSVLFGGFAPVIPDGFGVGYGCEDYRLGFNVTSYTPRNVHEFIQCAEKSLDDIYSVLEGRLPSGS